MLNIFGEQMKQGRAGRLHVIRNSNVVVSGNNMTSTRVGQTTFSDEISPTAWRTATTRTYYQNDLLNAEYHMKVYQGGNLVLPGRVALSGVYLDLRGNLTGVDHLVVGLLARSWDSRDRGRAHHP